MAQINWDAVSVVSAIVETVRVILSLIDLAKRIKLQNTELGTATIHDLTESFPQSIASFQNKELTTVFSKAKNNFKNRSETDRL